MIRFNPEILSNEDLQLAVQVLGGQIWRIEEPDLVIAPDGKPYLYRWELVRSKNANVYFHIQVLSDPERPLHDHPWDNFSVVLSGGYDEIMNPTPSWLRKEDEFTRQLRKGDVVARGASEAHRLILPPNLRYTMTLFTTGPKIREWGFWYPGGWRLWSNVTRTEGNKSVHVNPEAKNADT